MSGALAEDLPGYDGLIGVRYRVSMLIVEGKGRCIIAEEVIRSRRIIEVAPALVVEASERSIIDQTSMTNYYFNLRLPGLEEESGAMRGCVPLGIGNICNHSQDPNAAYCVQSSAAGFLFVLSSRRDIEPGEEICVRYREPWFDYKPPVRYAR